MAQLAFEFVYSAVVELLCYGTGLFILNALGLERLTRNDLAIGTVGFLFWGVVGVRAWELFCT